MNQLILFCLQSTFLNYFIRSRPSFCKDCGDSDRNHGGKPYLPKPTPPRYFPQPPPSSYSSGGSSHEKQDTNDDHAPHHSGGKPYLPTVPTDYNTPPTTYRPIDNFKPYSDARPTYQSGGNYHSGGSSDRFRPPYEITAIEKYRPPFEYPSYEPPPHSSFSDHGYNRYDVSNHYSSSPIYRPPSYDLDRYDLVKPIDRPIYSEISIYDTPLPHHHPSPSYSRPPSNYQSDTDYHSHRLPSQPAQPPPEYLGPYKPPYEPDRFPSYRPKKPERFPSSSSAHSYLDRDRELPPAHFRHPKPTESHPYIPYTINSDASPGPWASYGGSYGGGANFNQKSNDFWGLQNDFKRTDLHFNYFDLGNGKKTHPNDNAVLSYPGSRYDDYKHNQHQDKDKSYYGNLWTRRPGQDGK